jgi:hypothetical protein
MTHVAAGSPGGGRANGLPCHLVARGRTAQLRAADPRQRPGTVPIAEIISAVPEFMSIAATSDLPLDIGEVPLADVEPAWRRSGNGRLIVLRP